MTTQRDVERLLRDIPISTPEEVNRIETALQMFLSLVDAALDGAGRSRRVSNPAGDARNIVSQTQQGNNADAAVTLISIVGTAGEAVGLLTTVALEAGAISAVSTTAMAGTVGRLGVGSSPLFGVVARAAPQSMGIETCQI